MGEYPTGVSDQSCADRFERSRLTIYLVYKHGQSGNGRDEGGSGADHGLLKEFGEVGIVSGVMDKKERE